MNQNTDEYWMEKALFLAGNGKGAVSPNPMVGAVLVKRGRIVGEGYHAFWGGPHAEVRALKRAGKDASGATLYVTLEPCAAWGKTPPCAQAVVESRVRRVVIGMTDVNPENRLKGVRELRKAGIEVRTGVLAKQSRALNEIFCKWMMTGRPFVTLKMAQSLDGKIATRTGRSRWISSPAARRFVHQLRWEHDAVMVGPGTALADNPALTVRRAGRERRDSTKPWRVVIDPRWEVPSGARVFRGKQFTIRVVSLGSSKGLPKQRGRTRDGFILPVEGKRGRLSWDEIFSRLGRLGVSSVLVEGGGGTAWSLLHEKFVDRFFWIISPKFFGGREAPTSVEGLGVAMPSQALLSRGSKVSRLGEDFLIEGRL